MSGVTSEAIQIASPIRGRTSRLAQPPAPPEPRRDGQEAADRPPLDPRRHGQERDRRGVGGHPAAASSETIAGQAASRAGAVDQNADRVQDPPRGREAALSTGTATRKTSRMPRWPPPSPATTKDQGRRQSPPSSAWRLITPGTAPAPARSKSGSMIAARPGCRRSSSWRGSLRNWLRRRRRAPSCHAEVDA